VDQMTEQGERQENQGQVRGYTVALGTLALLMLLGALTMYSVRDAPKADPDARWALTFVMRIEAFLGIVAAVVVALRTRGSVYAYPATASLSWVLLFSFPIGTAFFVYWVWKVRPRERLHDPTPHPTSGAGRDA
jgi:hypothetical protein